MIASPASDSDGMATEFGLFASAPTASAVMTTVTERALSGPFRRMDTGLAIISRYGLKCGKRHDVGAMTTPGYSWFAADAGRTKQCRIGSPRETKAGRSANASSLEACAALRAIWGYVGMSGAAGRSRILQADGAKEIDCYA